MIAVRFARYGHRTGAARIFRGLFDASAYIDLKRLPELFCGFPRLRSHGPTFYPGLLAAGLGSHRLALAPALCLGISFDPENDYVVFDQPVLPRFVDDVTLPQLRLGEGRIAVEIARADVGAAVHVLARHGALRALTRS